MEFEATQLCPEASAEAGQGGCGQGQGSDCAFPTQTFCSSSSLQVCISPACFTTLQLPETPQHGQARWWPHSLVPHCLDGFCSTLVVVLLHMPVHGAQLHLPSEVDVH